MPTSPAPTDPHVLLRECEAADLLKLSVRTLQAWRSSGRGPRYCTAGRAIRYRRADLVEWIEANIVSPAAADPASLARNESHRLRVADR